MRRRSVLPALLAGVWQARQATPSGCGATPAGTTSSRAATTHGAIALAHLEAQLQQQADAPEALDLRLLRLLRLQFQADYPVLDRLVALAQAVPAEIWSGSSLAAAELPEKRQLVSSGSTCSMLHYPFCVGSLKYSAP